MPQAKTIFQSITVCAFSPDSQKIVSGAEDGSIKIWDAETGKERATLKGHTDRVGVCAFGPDGRCIVSGSDDNTLKLWGAETGKERATLKGDISRVRACAFSPDGRCIVSDSYGNILKLWDAETGEELAMLIDSVGDWLLTAMNRGIRVAGVTACTFSPDGRIILSASLDKTLKLWDAETRNIRSMLRGHTNSVHDCAYSPDGRRIISASSDKTLKLWNAQTLKELATFKGHTTGVSACAYSPDGRRIISASQDKILKLWDAETGEELATLTDPNIKMYACAFSPDGKRIVLGGASGQIFLLSIENIKNIEPSLPFATPVRMQIFGERGKRGYWDETIKATCQWCGKRFPVASQILDVIKTINHDADLSPDQSPCLELPDEAWDDANLLSECSLCHKLLKFNPFIVDNSKKKYRRNFGKLRE